VESLKLKVEGVNQRNLYFIPLLNCGATQVRLLALGTQGDRSRVLILLVGVQLREYWDVSLLLELLLWVLKVVNGPHAKALDLIEDVYLLLVPHVHIVRDLLVLVTLLR